MPPDFYPCIYNYQHKKLCPWVNDDEVWPLIDQAYVGNTLDPTTGQPVPSGYFMTYVSSYLVIRATITEACLLQNNYVSCPAAGRLSPCHAQQRACSTCAACARPQVQQALCAGAHPRTPCVI